MACPITHMRFQPPSAKSLPRLRPNPYLWTWIVSYPIIHRRCILIGLRTTFLIFVRRRTTPRRTTFWTRHDCLLISFIKNYLNKFDRRVHETRFTISYVPVFSMELCCRCVIIRYIAEINPNTVPESRQERSDQSPSWKCADPGNCCSNQVSFLVTRIIK